MTIVTMLTFIFEYYSTEKGIYNGRKIYIHPLMVINIKTTSVYENYLLNSLEPSSQNKKAYPKFFSQRIGCLSSLRIITWVVRKYWGEIGVVD